MIRLPVGEPIEEVWTSCPRALASSSPLLQALLDPRHLARFPLRLLLGQLLPFLRPALRLRRHSRLRSRRMTIILQHPLPAHLDQLHPCSRFPPLLSVLAWSRRHHQPPFRLHHFLPLPRRRWFPQVCARVTSSFPCTSNRWSTWLGSLGGTLGIPRTQVFRQPCAKSHIWGALHVLLSLLRPQAWSSLHVAVLNPCAP